MNGLKIGLRIENSWHLCLIFVKIHEFDDFLIRKKNRTKHFITSSIFRNSDNTNYSYTEATVEWEQWAVENSDADTGEDNEAAGDS